MTNKNKTTLKLTISLERLSPKLTESYIQALVQNVEDEKFHLPMTL
jgi:hypothetical protein